MHLQEPVEYRWHGEIILTTPGRVIFNVEIERSLEVAVHTTDTGRAHVHQPAALEARDRHLHRASSSTCYGAHAVATVLDTIKSLAFRYATQAGITVSKNDIVIPPNKEEILVGYEAQVREARAASTSAA